MKLYHGSPVHNIDNFALDSSKAELVEGLGVYFTDNYKLARGYAGEKGCIYLCMFNTSAIFDATNLESYYQLIELLSKKTNIDLKNIPYLKETIENLMLGNYQISDDYGKGLTWQIKNLLYDDENFSILKNQEEILMILSNEIKSYMKNHYILKYNDKHFGLIYLVKDPTVIKIIKEISVGSPEDLEIV